MLWPHPVFSFLPLDSWAMTWLSTYSVLIKVVTTSGRWPDIWTRRSTFAMKLRTDKLSRWKHYLNKILQEVKHSCEVCKTSFVCILSLTFAKPGIYLDKVGLQGIFKLKLINYRVCSNMDGCWDGLIVSILTKWDGYFQVATHHVEDTDYALQVCWQSLIAKIDPPCRCYEVGQHVSYQRQLASCISKKSENGRE